MLIDSFYLLFNFKKVFFRIRGATILRQQAKTFSLDRQQLLIHSLNTLMLLSIRLFCIQLLLDSLSLLDLLHISFISFSCLLLKLLLEHIYQHVTSLCLSC